MIKKRQINFLKPAKFLSPLSVAVSFLALASILLLGFKYGIDFSGGNELQVRFEKKVTAGEIRQVLTQSGVKNASVQKFGTERESTLR